MSIGTLLSEHKTSTRGFVKVIGLSLVGLLVASAFLSGAILSGDSNIGGRVIMGIFGLLFLLVPALGVYGLARGRGNAIRIHENGMVIHQRGVDTAILWDDIATYDDGPFLIVGTKDEQSFEFGMDGLRAGSEIVAKLRDEVTVKRAVPRMKATLLEGSAGSFESDGDPSATPAEGVIDVTGFRVDIDGIAPLESDELTPWSDVTGCSVEEKTIELHRLTRVMSFVVITSKTQTFRALINTRSDREACVGLCKEMLVR